MNENSSFKGKEKLLDDDDLLSSKNSAPLLGDQKTERKEAVVFKVYNPEKGRFEEMYFNKKKKKSNKD